MIHWAPPHESKCVVRSDESSVTLVLTTGRVHVWKRPNEAYHPVCLVSDCVGLHVTALIRTHNYSTRLCDILNIPVYSVWPPTPPKGDSLVSGEYCEMFS